MDNPRYSTGPTSKRVRDRKREKRAREAMERAEKYAPGLSIDMMDRPTPTPTPPPAPGMKKGGMARSSASKRADGCAVKGKTRGKFV